MSARNPENVRQLGQLNADVDVCHMRRPQECVTCAAPLDKQMHQTTTWATNHHATLYQQL